MTQPPSLETPPLANIIFNKTIIIYVPTAKVWEALTNPMLMQGWMADINTQMDIFTDWQVGHPMVMRGHLHGIEFENTGTVLQFEPKQLLEYCHLSSLSKLPDVPASYTHLEFRLAPAPNGTTLTLTVRNFPTETIYKHLAFYWNVTLEVLKRTLENPASTPVRPTTLSRLPPNQ